MSEANELSFSLCSDDLIEPIDDLHQLLGFHGTKLGPNPINRQGPNLTDLYPGLFREFVIWKSVCEGKSRVLWLTCYGHGNDRA